MLATFIKSPVDYFETFVTCKMAKKPTKQMVTGNVCHAVLLEGKALDDCFLVYPESCLNKNGAINPKPASEFRECALALDKNVIGFGKARELIEIDKVLSAINRHELGKLISQADHREHTMHGAYNGRKIKCKPDFYWPGLIYDLKFMEDVSPGQINRSFRNFSYWLQDAHYSAVVGGNPGFRFWIVETQYPYRIKTRKYDARSREIGHDSWRRWMDCFIQAELSNEWVDGDADAEMTLSPYDMPDQDEEEIEDASELNEVAF